MRGARIVVVGMGRSGIAAAGLALRRGARVTCMDQNGDFDDRLDTLVANGASLILGRYDAAVLDAADRIVLSPGVPDFPELLHAEKSARVPVIGELELGVVERTSVAPIVAIGGTNGKSTVTTLVAKLLEAHGLSVFAGGNLGEPASTCADDPLDALVLEVSSFQLERAPTFCPRVSVLLNVTPDHLDRYPSFAAYAHAKGNAFVNQHATDVAVVPHDDDVCLAEARRGGARVVTFGTASEATFRITPEAIAWGTNAIQDAGGGGGTLERAKIALTGEHNMRNVCAAVAVALEFDVSVATIAGVLERFTGLAHRVAFVRELNGVRFYDDSKGTNVGASIAALTGMREPHVVLIAGGRDKGGSYGPLAAALEQNAKGRAVVTLGEAAPLIEAELTNRIPTKRARSMEEAVALAYASAEPGDAVLLSPACSSFDMFRDYAHRGEAFATATNSL